MNVLVASHLYPSDISRTAGSFVHNQVRFLRDHCSVEVVSPTPFFPLPGFGRWSQYRSLAASEALDGVLDHRVLGDHEPRTLRRFFGLVVAAAHHGRQRQQENNGSAPRAMGRPS